MKTKQKWLDLAYKHFAAYGPEKLSLKRISEEIDVPRTTFYHYFADKEDLVQELLGIFMDQAEMFVEEGHNTCKQLIPDLHILLHKYASGLKFCRQLFLNRYNPVFNMVYMNVNKKSNEFIIPLFIEYYNFNIPYQTAEQLWDSLTDTWYSRLNPDDLSPSTMSQLTEEIMHTILQFVNSKVFAHIS